jgi:hypothetical protein
MPQFDFYVFLDIYINGFLFFMFMYILMTGYFLPFFYKGFYLRLFFNLNLNYIDQYFDYNKSLINLLTKKTLFFSFFFFNNFLKNV